SAVGWPTPSARSSITARNCAIRTPSGMASCCLGPPRILSLSLRPCSPTEGISQRDAAIRLVGEESRRTGLEQPAHLIFDTHLRALLIAAEKLRFCSQRVGMHLQSQFPCLVHQWMHCADKSRLIGHS